MIQWRFEADGGGEIYSAALAGSSGEKTRTPPYGRGVGGRCIIDEALYRQTKLNTEALAAPPRRTPPVGGWVGAGVGGSTETCYSLHFVIVFAGKRQKANREDYKMTYLRN